MSATTRSRRVLWLLAVLLVVVGAGAVLSPAAAPRWQTIAVRKGDIESSVLAVGTVQPTHSVEVGAQVSGQITTLHVKAGDVVQKGQLLAEIDASVLAATVEAGHAQIQDLQAQAQGAQAQHELARLQLERQRLMQRNGSTRKEDVEVAVADRKLATARLAQIKAQIVRVKASLKADEARLGYTRIYAPIAGTVTGVDVKEGQTLNATYQTPTVMRLADLSQMTVWTDVSEADIRRVKPGMPVYFNTLGGDRRRWHSEVRQVLPAPVIDPEANSASAINAQSSASKAVQYTVLFDVENADGALMPQMTAQVTFVAGSAEGVLIAPLSAFKASEQNPRVYEAMVLPGDAEAEPELRSVRLGRRDRLEVEVRQGLEEGERLVTGVKPAASSEGLFRW